MAGVGELVRDRTKRGDEDVTRIVDVTPVRWKRIHWLLDLIGAGSKALYTNWLQEETQAWYDGVEVVPIVGLAGLKAGVASRFRCRGTRLPTG